MTPFGLNFIEESKKLVQLKGKVLEVGSRFVRESGDKRTIRSIFKGHEFVGTDVEAGNNVDQVVSSYDLVDTFGEDEFHCVVSGDALEHIEFWTVAVMNMWGVLKKGGWLILTTVDEGKAYHGYPNDYWRFDLCLFDQLFRKQEFVNMARQRAFVAVAVRKSKHPLDVEGILAKSI